MARGTQDSINFIRFSRKQLCALCEISFALFAVKLQLNRKERKEVRRKGAQRS
jgi:hypothetical protein